MRSPKDMEIIQIDVTNACPKKCANCTRFCGNHKKTYFMDLDYYKKVVDSLEDYDGIVGMIGGEPTLNPNFKEMSKYVGKRLDGKVHFMRKPILDMTASMHSINDTPRTGKSSGIWSLMGPGFYRHIETIGNSFNFQILNDHLNPCEHQGLLMARKDFNIPDDEFFKLRDGCWIQNTWSAAITPKGAFFCEVAANLDILFHGPGGWDISDKNWWKREPHEFGEQLEWCEICGCCLDTPRRISNDERDDLSKTLLEMLKKVESPKIMKGNYVLHEDLTGKRFTTNNEYMGEHEFIRASTGQKELYPKHISCAKIGDSIDTIAKQTDKKLDWVWMSLDGKTDKPTSIDTIIFNHGCLYIYEDKWIFFSVRAESLTNFNNSLSINLEQLKSLYNAYDVVCIDEADLCGTKSCEEQLVGRKLSFLEHIFSVYTREEFIEIMILGIKISIKRKAS